MFNHNNITYKNYINNSSSLKINQDTIKKKKKQFINLHGRNMRNIFDIDNDIDNNNNDNIIYNKETNKTIEMNFNSMNLDINKTNIGVYNKKCSSKYRIETTPTKNNINNLNQTSNFINKSIVKKKNLIYNKSFLTDRAKKGNMISLKSGNILNKYIKMKAKDNFKHKSNNKQIKKEEINPITKVKNIIKNIKLNLSLSTGKINNNEKNDNLYSMICDNNYSDDRMNNNNNNSFLYNVNKTEYRTINESKYRKNYKRKIDTSQILNECMNNVIKRLIANDNEKTNKTNERLQIKKLFTSANDHKTLKHYKIKKQLCLDLFNSNDN